MSINTPWIINSNELEELRKNNQVVIIDMSNRDSYAKNHIPGAIFFDYSLIVKHQPPVVGLLPDAEHLSNVLSTAGIKPEDYLVIYDEEGGGKAGRLIWTLEIAGHKKMSLLDGGIVNWILENKPVTQTISTLPASKYSVSYINKTGVADADYILTHLAAPNTVVLDVRSANEFHGIDVRSTRAGHIPGAVNIDWLAFKNPANQKLLEQSALSAQLEKKGVTPTKEIIVHCHSHHRSALCYVALKHLGFEKVRGYPASWSDWATRTNTPVEI